MPQPLVTTYPTGTTTVPVKPGAVCECCTCASGGVPAVCTVTSEAYPVDVCQACFDITERELVVAQRNDVCNFRPRRSVRAPWRRLRGA